MRKLLSIAICILLIATMMGFTTDPNARIRDLINGTSSTGSTIIPTGGNDAQIVQLQREIATEEERLERYQENARKIGDVTSMMLVQSQSEFLNLKRQQLFDLLHK